MVANKKNNKPDPFRFMVENRKIIIEIIQENESIPKAWEILKEKIPMLTKLIKLNTFKGYVKTLNIIDELKDKNDKIMQENEDLKIWLDKVRQDKEKQKDELDKVRQDKEKQKTELDKVRQDIEKNLHKLSIVNEELDKVRYKKESLEFELDKVRQIMEKNKIKSERINAKFEEELGKVREENKSIIIKLDKVREEKNAHLEKKSNKIESPNRIEGWGIQFKGNYYRLFKKLNGKVKWIHIGRKWDTDLAKRKIKNFMS